MRAFHIILHADMLAEPRRIDFQAAGPDHAFQIARNESDGVQVDLWEGDQLLARMTKSGANIWKLHESSCPLSSDSDKPDLSEVSGSARYTGRAIQLGGEA